MNATPFLIVLLAATGCASDADRAQSPRSSFIENCPDDAQGTVALSASAVPIALPSQVEDHDRVETPGVLGRRLIISVTPQHARRAERIVWTAMTVRSFGGDVSGWTRLQTDYTRLEVSPLAKNQVKTNERGRREEIATVELGSGEILVTRTALTSATLAGTTTLDLLVTPGGIAVDESILKIPQLWDDGRAISPTALQPQLVAVRHPPGMDAVEAELKLRYVLLRAKNEWSCTTETHVVLVDKASVRQPFWDIGTSSYNAGRDRWLALRSPQFGVIRAIFDAPSAANSFVEWIRATHATTAGEFTLGLFTGNASALRPAVPVDRDIGASFHPLDRVDIDSLRVGPLGEP